jgi:hypothetical protein
MTFAPTPERVPLGREADEPALLVLHVTDNTAVALRDLAAGEHLTAQGRAVRPLAAVRAGHKIALAPIAEGAEVRKYGVVIGTATVDIAAGDHVHVHNVESERMRGDRRDARPQGSAA